MFYCPICEKIKSHAKSNTHVIPKSLIAPTKVNGKNVFISPDIFRERNQKDIALNDGWCIECENVFKEDDDFAPLFFKDNYFLIADKKIEKHDPSASRLLKKFIISIIIRHSIYLEKKDESFLGPHFKILKDDYLSGRIINERYPLLGIKYTDLNILGYPTRERFLGLNSIESYLGNYRFVLLVDQRHILPHGCNIMELTDIQLNFLVASYKNTPLQKNLFEKIELIKEKSLL